MPKALSAADLSPKDVQRFWSKVSVGPIDDCWPWLGSPDCHGYGQFRMPNGYWKAHRVAYALANGGVAKFYIVRHTCDNPPCCNPAHLVAGSYQDNMDDKVARGRCPRGDSLPQTRLSTSDAFKVKALLVAGFSSSELADNFGVSVGAINYIKRGERKDIGQDTIGPGTSQHSLRRALAHH